MRNRDFAFPVRIAPPMLARYEPGMGCGVHADAGHMRLAAGLLRSDLSCTNFFADPAGYEGGELTIHLGTRVVLFKGAPGDAVVYPSTTLHEVRPVTSGARLVSITFIESLIADERKREALCDLSEVSALEGPNTRWENRVRLEAARQNLIRMWSAEGMGRRAAPLCYSTVARRSFAPYSRRACASRPALHVAFRIMAAVAGNPRTRNRKKVFTRCANAPPLRCECGRWRMSCGFLQGQTPHLRPGRYG